MNALKNTRVLTEAALAVALAVVLSFVKVFEMPLGGSVSLEMFPLILLALRQGARVGVAAGVVYGLIDILTPPVFVFHPVQVLLDYPLAFGALGLAGLFRPTARGALAGAAVAVLARFACHFLSGVVFFASYAPEGWNPYVYSAAYNAAYLVPSLLVAAVVVLVLLRETAARSDLVVAADGGARHALEAGVTPDLVVGDMDSLGEDGARRLEERGAVLERHPVEKDEMDGQLAIGAARGRGAAEADLLCALGGRTSAVFALPHLLLAAERVGLRATVFAGWGRVFVVEDGSRAVEGEPGDGVSVFPVAGPAGGVTLEGLAYPLGDARLGPGDTLGFHNEIVGGTARVTVDDGALLVVYEGETFARTSDEGRSLWAF